MNKYVQTLYIGCKHCNIVEMYVLALNFPFKTIGYIIEKIGILKTIKLLVVF